MNDRKKTKTALVSLEPVKNALGQPSLEGSSNDRFLIYRTKGGIEVDLRVESDTFWASQAQMAKMFDTTQQTVSEHIRNIHAEGELPDNERTHRNFLLVRQEGQREVRRNIDHYDLNTLISVGYRVGGPMGTMFRVWATDKLFQYLTKGFVIDDERLKNPDGRPDHFDELLERIRDIRASEKRMWTHVLDLASFCSDYNADDRAQHTQFFAEIQNTMHWAVHQRTAPEMVMERVHASKENAGVMVFKGKTPTIEEAKTAKNLLLEPEIKALNHITTLVLEFFESQAEQRKLTTLAEFLAKMRDLVNLDGRPLKKPGYAGTVTRKKADAWVSKQVKAYKTRMRLAAEIEGEKLLSGVASAIKANKRKKAG